MQAMQQHNIRLDGVVQAKEEVDKLQQLMKDRSSLAFGSALVCCFQSM